MKTTIIGLLLIFLICFFSGNILSQDIHFSQLTMSPLTYNPGMTGKFFGDIRCLGNYKTQWKSAGSPYTTFAMAYDMKLNEKKWTNGFIGIGFLAFRDEAGDTHYGNTTLDISVSGIVLINSAQSISGGIQGGISQTGFSTDGLIWDEQYVSGAYDPANSSGESLDLSPSINGDIGAGVTWHYFTDKTNMVSNDQFNLIVGAAVTHINRPELKFYTGNEERLYRKIAFNVEAISGVKGTNIALAPSAVVLLQGPSKEINLGLLIRYMLKEGSKYTGIYKESAISFGTHYRVGDAIVPSVLLEVGSYAIGIGYDVNISKLKAATLSRGGMEISLRYVNPNPFIYRRVSKSLL